MYKPNEEKQNFLWVIKKKQWFASFQHTSQDMCLTEGDSTKCLVSSVQKKGEANLPAISDLSKNP